MISKHVEFEFAFAFAFAWFAFNLVSVRVWFESSLCSVSVGDLRVEGSELDLRLRAAT